MKRLQEYLEEYLVPATSRILGALNEKGRADYGAAVEVSLR
jgi:hypothetical protein